MIEKEWMINRGVCSVSTFSPADEKQDFSSPHEAGFGSKVDELNNFFGEEVFSYTDSTIVGHVDGELIEIQRNASSENMIDEQEINETIESVINQFHGDVLEEINNVTKYTSIVLNGANDEQYELLLNSLKKLEQKHKRIQVRMLSNLADITEDVFALIYGELSQESKKRIRNCAEKMILNLSSPIAAARALTEGKFEEFQAIKGKVEVEEKLCINKPESEQNSSAKFNSSPLLSAMISKFLSWDEGGRVRNSDVIKNYKNDLDILINVIGDVPVGQVTKQNIKDVIKIREMMPVRNKKPYSKWSIKDTIDHINSGGELDDEDDLVSTKTVKETFKTYQSFFSAYLCDSLDKIQISPTTGLSVPADIASYGKYSDSQMEKIVGYWKSQSDSDFKMVILAACYTGMRKSEIANLTSDSLRFDEDSGRYYIFIASGKTKAAKRIVPIANELIDIGFVDYVKAMPAKKKLFSKKTDLITDVLKKSREVLNIPDVDTNERRLVFHSLRHSVISKARAQGISDPILQNVVGHQTRKSITDTYTHFDVKDLVCVIDCLDW
ncbi:tyrosine-type recombinase/integrase [Tolumonas auensis]|uniref:tyrosine-type recombinase/integrase n=1 Tax=Tolumonas auensis TaxID=43948 RepID=UPI002AA81966|nr:tyrosine-type recombinase/integrase [Tolumonas auensis]